MKTWQKLQVRDSVGAKTDGWFLLFPALFGFAAYAYVTRLHGLWPGDVQWLLPYWNGGIDSAQHYLGWEFFRQAPMLQWPLGKTPNLGQGVGGSVAMTDSLPLFAFIFKPFTYWSSAPFQYFGIWTMTCFVLQAVFGWKLLSVWSHNRLHLLIGTGFFLFTPAFIDRFSFHLALAGHWIILASLYLYFTSGEKFKKWLALGCIAILVQPYLAMIATVLFIADTSTSLIISTQTWIAAIRRLVIYFGILVFTGWQSGLFVFGVGSASGAGFGQYSANGFTFIDPGYTWYSRQLWSSRVPDQWQSDGQTEGLAFLGTGVILLAILVLPFFVKKVRIRYLILTCEALFITAITIFHGITLQLKFLILFGLLVWFVVIVVSSTLRTNWKRTISLVAAMALLGVFALSNIVYFGDFHLISYPLPTWLMGVVSIFRTSGRAIWPLMYLVIAAVIVGVFKKFWSWVAVVAITGCLVFQIVDSRHAIAITSDVYKRSGPERLLYSPLWKKFGKTYKHISIVYPYDTPNLIPVDPDFLAHTGKLWRDVGVFAVKYRMSMDAFYFSREPTNAIITAVEESEETVKNQSYRPDTLYFFIDPTAWTHAKKHHRQNDLIGVLDGFPILAPGLYPCLKCDLTSFVARG